MARPSNASKALAGLSVAELHREIERRSAQHGKLSAERDRLQARLSEIQRELGGAGPVRGPGRPKGSKNRGPGRPRKAGKKGRGGRTPAGRHRNEKTLVAHLQDALNDTTLSIGEAMEAIAKAGYKSTSKNLRTMISVALGNKKVFKRMGRGQYTAAKG